MVNPLNCLTGEQEGYLLGKVKEWFDAMNDTAPQQLLDAGFLFPTKPPEIWTTLPDEWDEMMDQGGIYNLMDKSLEEYLEKWLRLLGYAYWVQGLWNDRYQTLTRCRDFIKDYVFAHSDGGREQKAAVSGAHWITAEVTGKLNEAERKLTELNGLIRKWEKIEFSISRSITSRQGRGNR
ncbi:hypothetical protein IAQ67_28825 (plasmid) [Paenibacillus peoriae]|uniref:Uncharacterized protein n=1 Tax=Paenibacillus peoriae TaxID=59893 RepID=A0A7H0YH04_9BACL|nr:hypothetical protein [Paenibacillus peoriae]QNR70362.1 hypothetical protein IAQ67_28825 [Paenibacillus peoriae]